MLKPKDDLRLAIKLRSLRLTPSEQDLVEVLAKTSGEDRIVRMTHVRLSELSGRSQHSVKRGINRLMAVGLLDRVRETGNPKAAGVYKFALPGDE